MVDFLRREASLNGNWKATDTIATDLAFVRTDFDDSCWVDIEVPGHWQTVPEFADYPEKLIYRRRFDAAPPAPGRRLFVRFSGIFYFCRVWINGKYLGEHTGYFKPFEFDISDSVRSEGNVLTVFVRCNKEKDSNDKRQVLGIFANWDCKPDSVQPGGIWDSVSLIEKSEVFLDRVCIGDFDISGPDATALVHVALEGPDTAFSGDLKIEWKISPDNFEGEPVHGEFLPGESEGNARETAFEVSIPDARLWWTWDHGDQNLYRLDMNLVKNGAAIDSASVRFGVRTIEMKDFIVRVNGRRVFCRGSNYAPGDIRIASATRELYEKDADLMLGANMNMIRVHAHVEKTEFYDVCDEKGILVWQDFPLHMYYAREIEEQAVQQIREMVLLLMRHPSVAIWCCHNEPFKMPADFSPIDAIKGNRLQDFVSALSSMMGNNWNKDSLDRILERIVVEVDGGRPVVPHSGINGMIREGTDGHLYFGWYYGTMRILKTFAGLYRKALRFVTEYGAQAYPSIENFKKLQDVSEISEIDWDKLQKEHMLQKKIMDKFVPVKKGGSLEDYIGFSQWYQERLIKYYNEFLRGLKYNPCGGAVHFLFNDCCPAITWSVLDYWRAPKKGYEALAASFRPVHIAAEFPKRWYPCGEMISLKTTALNDTYQSYPGSEIRWKYFDSEGKPLAEGLKAVDLPEDSVVSAGRAKWDSHGAAPGGYALVLELLLPGSESPIVNQYEFELRK